MIVLSPHIHISHLNMYDTSSEIKENEFANLLCFTTYYENKIGDIESIVYYLPYRYASRIE